VPVFDVGVIDERLNKLYSFVAKVEGVYVGLLTPVRDIKF
jgi:hypothetical protein